MKQQMEILVVTEVDHDKQNALNSVYERLLADAIKKAVKEIIGTPKRATNVDITYGDPV